MKLCLVTLAAAILSCAPDYPPSHLELHVDSTASAEVLADVQAAAVEWAVNTGATINVGSGLAECRDAGCFDVTAMPAGQLDAWANRLSGQDVSGRLGYTDRPGPGIIGLDVALTGDKLRVTVLHEMGHALGLVHQCGPHVACDSVMAATWGFGADYVTCEDVAQYDQKHGKAVAK